MMSCVKCPFECKECNSKDDCVLCKSGYFLENKTCKKCKNNCDSCFGKDGYLCNSCAQGFYLFNFSCFSECNINNGIGYYADHTTR